MKDYDPSRPQPMTLHETAFQNLMQRRVHNVLLIASPYDTFMLEEDGRVEEQIYRPEPERRPPLYQGNGFPSGPRANALCAA